MPPSRECHVGVDLGGTSLRAALVRDGKLLASSGRKTRPDRGPEGVIERVAAVVRDVLEEAGDDAAHARAVCVGAPGTVDAATGVVTRAPNLGWEDVPLAEELSREVDLPVFVDNDVNVGVLGEHVHGAGRGTLDMVGIFVGTGIGGGIIVGGHPHTGARGAAGELGHMVVEPGGRRCPCGNEGCVEAYASKTAMEALVRERVEAGRGSLVPELMRKKGKDRISSSVVEKALAEGDEVMGEALAISQRYLAVLVTNVVNILDPEVVVFGGGIVERLGTSFVDPIAEQARPGFIRKDPGKRIRIVPGTLGDDAGTIGAAVEAGRRMLRVAG